ncbi:hypothetical protein [Streptomyces sp. Wb2n-11]|uniref:hypothetical protein n=1 Tax=Streptomyces sp. Wb2n-11 TaxID=1030533 RepID=UPI000B148BE2|nr:hypothetical protein [Streptomyces sp. Wb2n-11]
MEDAQSLSVSVGPGAVLRWAQAMGLVADEGEERRLAAMKLDMPPKGPCLEGPAGGTWR